MFNWLGRFLGIGRSVSNKIPQQASKAKGIQEIMQKAETKCETAIPQTIKPKAPSLGSQLSYGKWYYGIDASANPVTRKNILGDLERRYPCKGGGEVVVTYHSRPDKTSKLTIEKIGNPDDVKTGEFYKRFYSDTAVTHYQNMFGEDCKRIVKKKGASKQEFNTRHGNTHEVHVPLKRWETSVDEMFGHGKRKDSFIDPSNPRDFDRFCD